MLYTGVFYTPILYYFDSHTYGMCCAGRAGEKGCAFSLVTHAQADTAAFLVRSLMEVPHPISQFFSAVLVQKYLLYWYKNTCSQ